MNGYVESCVSPVYPQPRQKPKNLLKVKSISIRILFNFNFLLFPEICKLFSKKFSIDVAEGGKVKKHSRNEFNFEATTNKCQSMSYFDQHVVTWQCAVTVQEMLNSFAMGNSNYLPVQEHVAFLFDLMEMALNIYGLIDMCIQILKELPDVEALFMTKNSTLAKSYTTCLSLYVVGVLRRYHCCLLCMNSGSSV